MNTETVTRHTYVYSCESCQRMHMATFATYQEAINHRKQTIEAAHALGITPEVSQMVMVHHAVARPKTIVLCGSCKFYKQFQEANFQLTRAGYFVLSVGFYPHDEETEHGGDMHITPEQKIIADNLHKQKIEWADEVFVINPEGYIGESTRSEIEFAKHLGRPIHYLVPTEL